MHATWVGKTTKLKPESIALAIEARDIIAGYNNRVTLRQVFYQLVSRNIIENTERAYKNLGNLLVKARESGIVEWSAMEDRGRSIDTASTYDSVDQFKRVMRYMFDQDRWINQQRRVAVIVEKAALAGVIEPVCRQYQTPFIAARGYASATLVAEASVALRDHAVLYLGDHDPSGVDMARDWQDRLRNFDAGCFVQRIALTRDQIEMFSLPPQPVKAADARATAYESVHGSGVWELDALPPDELGRLVQSAIESFIDPEAWNERDEEIEALRDLIFKD